MLENLKIDLFSVSRRSFPGWETVRQIEQKLAKNSLINYQLDDLEQVAKQRAQRLVELIDEENESGIVYFCERYWLESQKRVGLPYKSWVNSRFRPFVTQSENESVDSRVIEIGLRDFLLPPLLSDQTRQWIRCNDIYPRCVIFSSLSEPVDQNWYVQAAHLLHHLNYYLEFVNENASDEDRLTIFSFDHIYLYPKSHNSQIWQLDVNPDLGPMQNFFLRDETLLREGYVENRTDGPCWFPGCSHEIPDIDPDFIGRWK